MYTYSHITKLTVIAELEEIKVCAERLKPETPFMDAAIICMRGFFILWGVARELGSDNLAEGRQKLEDATERVKMWFKSLLAGHAPHHKITSLKRFHLVSLQRYMKNEYYKKLALLAPATSTMINGLYKRVMAFFASCEQFRYSKRFDCWNENISILTLYMGGGLGHGERCNNV